MKKPIITSRNILTGILVIALLSGAFMFSISSPSGIQPETDVVDIIRYVNSRQDLRDPEIDCIREQALSANYCSNTVTTSQYGEIQLEHKNDFNLGLWVELGASLACDYTEVEFSIKNQKTGVYEKIFSQNADYDERKYFTGEPCTSNINLLKTVDYDEKADKFYYSCINKSFTIDYITDENKVEVLIFVEGDSNQDPDLLYYSCRPEIAISLLNAPLDPNPPEETIIDDTIEIIEDIPEEIIDIIEEIIPPTEDELVDNESIDIPIDESIIEDIDETIIDDIDKTQIDDVSIIDDCVEDSIFIKMGRYLDDIYNYLKNLFK